MKTLILYSGHLGSTEKAARYLQTKIDNAILMNTADSPKVDFGAYDAVVFGTNVRMFKLNRRFRKYAKKSNKFSVDSYVFVVGADYDNAERQVSTAKSLLKNCKEGVFIGGVLDPSVAKGFAKNVINTVIAAMKKDERELPSLDYAKLDELAESLVKN